MKDKMKNNAEYIISIILINLINIIVGTWSVIEILSWFEKSIPIFANTVIALFVAKISVPVAIVGYLLRLFGVF